MRAVVIDTNVMLVANGEAEQADVDCEQRCQEALVETQRNRLIVLDGDGHLFAEYRRNLSAAGQPGLGDAFFKWLWDNQAHPRHCALVSITPRPGNPDDFEEFPHDAELEGFDPKDRKFVAVARASAHAPTILNAVDPDWKEYEGPLRRHGVKIAFLCPKMMHA
jgi:hypothetical protein